MPIARVKKNQNSAGEGERKREARSVSGILRTYIEGTGERVPAAVLGREIKKPIEGALTNLSRGG